MTMRKITIFSFLVCFGFIQIASANKYLVSTLTAKEKSKTMVTIDLWLKLNNEPKLDKLLAAIYSPTSPQYQKFITWKQFYQQFSPTAEMKNNVKEYLTANDFKILPSKEHFYIRAQGSLASIEKTFKVNIKRNELAGETYFNNTTMPIIGAQIANYVNGVSFNFRAPFHSKCISRTEQKGNFQAVYGIHNSIPAKLVDEQDNVISANMKITGFTPNGTHNSGYTPRQIQKAYGVDTLLAQNINGTDQTVVIIDTCISRTLQDDLDAFTFYNHLPALVHNTNFFITPYAPPVKKCGYGGKDVSAREETLDIESFHTMAPNAKIILAVSTNEDTQAILADAIEASQAGYLISSSHSEPEFTVTSMEPTLKAAAAAGITVNISSGDCGDNTVFSQANFHKSVNYPSSSTWVTAVGGTALFLDKDDNYWFETGWGTARNVSYVCRSGSPVCNTFTEEYQNLGGDANGFVEGSTGGISKIYPAQPWQQNAISSLWAGGYGIVGDHIFSQNPLTNYRAVPDISMFADGYYPGFEIYITAAKGENPSRSFVGGTSLACPLFTGILALASQQRAHPIGLASRFLYDLPPGAVHTISNPHGIGNPIAGLPNPNVFQLFQTDPSTGNLQGVVFNFDSSLTLGAIWSDVVGVGSPYAPLFVKALADQ